MLLSYRSLETLHTLCTVVEFVDQTIKISVLEGGGGVEVYVTVSFIHSYHYNHGSSFQDFALEGAT